MELKAVLLDEKAVQRTLKRISHEIIEKNKGTEDIVLIGIKSRGVPLATRIANIIESIEGNKIPVGSVDITMYRDDIVLSSEKMQIPNKVIDIEIKDKIVILVDDVLYTARTARAAIDAIIDTGRPKMIQLAVLIDRGHREIPIRADFVGKNVPTSKEEAILVKVSEIDEGDSVSIYEL